MNTNNVLTIDIFDPEETLVALLENGGVEFEYKAKNPAIKIARDRSINIRGNSRDLSHIAKLATVFVKWLEADSDRKIQAQLHDCTIIYLEGRSIEDITAILKNTLKLIVFDLEYNNAIIRNNNDVM